MGFLNFAEYLYLSSSVGVRGGIVTRCDITRLRLFVLYCRVLNSGATGSIDIAGGPSTRLSLYRICPMLVSFPCIIFLYSGFQAACSSGSSGPQPSSTALRSAQRVLQSFKEHPFNDH